MADAAKDNTDFEKLFSFSDVGQSLMPTLLNLIENSSCKSVAILGLSYGPSFKVHTNSPTFAIIKQLSPIIDNVSVHDPFYSAEEINALTGCTAIENLKELSDFDAVIIVTPHPYYTNNFTDILTAIKKNNSLLIDNLGVFRELASSVVRYWEVGSKAAENI